MSEVKGQMTTEEIFADEVLSEATVDSLLKNIKDTKNFNTTKRQFSTHPIGIDDIEVRPQPRSKNQSALIQSSIAGSTGKEYDVKVRFDNIHLVKPSEEDKFPEAIPVRVKVGNQKTHKMMPLNKKKNPVKVGCTCPDFQWRFAWWNNKNGSLLGAKPKPYKKKTDRPPVNANQVEGVCKHIIKVLDALEDTGILK